MYHPKWHYAYPRG